MEYAEKQHSQKSDSRGAEIQPTNSPHAEQRRKIQQAVHRGQDDGSQHRLWKVLEQAGEKEQAKRKRHRGKDECQGRARASLVIHGRLRQATGYRVTLPHRCCEVGCPDPQKLLPGIEGISVFGSEGAGGGDALNIRQQHAAGCQGCKRTAGHRMGHGWFLGREQMVAIDALIREQTCLP